MKTLIKIISFLLLLASWGFAQDSTSVKINEYKKDLKTIQELKQKTMAEVQQKTEGLKSLTALENFHLYKIKTLSDSTRVKKWN